MAVADELRYHCPTCGVEPYVGCRDLRGKPREPHKDRGLARLQILVM